MNYQTNFIIKVWVIAGCFFFSGLPVIYALTTISSFYPASGPVGTLVTVTGTGLSGPTSFTIGGTAAIVVSNTGTTLVGMVMPGTESGFLSISAAGVTATSTESFTVIELSSPTYPQGGKFTGSDASGMSSQGCSVALSADGNTVIVGGSNENFGIGAAWIYTRTGNSWTQQGNKLVGTGATGAAQQGISVSLSADGNTAIVGGYNDNSGAGAVWVYTRSGNTWTQQGSKLVGTGATGASYQGYSVSLSADGNTAMVGGYNDNSGAGAVWIYTRSGNTWTQQGSKLVGSGAMGTSFQGYSVSLSADGNTAIAGGYNDMNGIGGVWIYTRNGNSWAQQGSKLVGTGATGNSFQGHSVSLSADGKTAIAGGYNDNSGAGAVWIFTSNGNEWTQQGGKLVGAGAVGNAAQGYSVALSADGNKAIVGGYRDNNFQGATWLFARSGNIWSMQGNKFVGTGAIGQSNQGKSVSVSANGTTAITGGDGDNTGVGAVWGLVSPPPAITSFSPVTGPVGTVITITGTNLNGLTSLLIGGIPAVIVSDSYSIVKGIVMPGTVTGKVSLTTTMGTASSGLDFTAIQTPCPSGQQGDKLTGTGASGTSYQGNSVSMSADGNTAIVGGPYDNSNIGAAWVYTRSGNTWTQQGPKLVGTGATGQSYQGWSVSLSADGNTAIVGGYRDNNYIGAAWVFTRSGNTWTQQGSKLVGTGAIVAWQGFSVSLSADGNTAIVGGPNDSGQVGAVWIFSRYGNRWFQLGNKLVGTDASGLSYQGWSVSLSADGNTAITGGYLDNSNTGAAWVYSRNGNKWTQQGTKLVGTGATGKASQGLSVSLSADGNTAIVGGKFDNNFIGAAWVYTRSGTAWTQQGAKLVGTGAISQSGQGSSVALSADGNTAIVGGTWDNTNVGAVWVFTRSESTWTQQGKKLVGDGAILHSGQGCSVAISADGHLAIVGGNMDNNNSGAAWVFKTKPPVITSFSPEYGPVGSLVTITGTDLINPLYFYIGGVPAVVVSNTGTTLVGMVMPGAYTNRISINTPGGTATSGNNFIVHPTPFPYMQQGIKFTGTGVTGYSSQGYSVALSADGNTAIVGGNMDNNYVGAAWIFTRSGDTWTQQGGKLTGTGAIGAANQGSSVSLSADGNTAIVGGSDDNSNKGAAWIYIRNGNSWVQQGSKLTGNDATANAHQGQSVSLSADGNTAIVGGPGDNSFAGAVWIYTRDNNTWTQQGSKLTGTGSTGAASQGTAVSLSADGNTALVGGSWDNSYNGATWVFTRKGDNWTQQGNKLVGAGAIGPSNQGRSVFLSANGNTAIVGGITDNNNIGAAWVYTRSGNTWTQQGNKLVGSGAIGQSYQGQAVSLSADGNTAIVGGFGDNSNIGAAWVFTRSGSTWSQQGNKLTGTNSIHEAKQGYSVSVSADGKTAIIGGYGDYDNIGAVWIFKTIPPSIASFTPDAGPVGTLVTINGTNLNRLLYLNIGGSPAVIISNTGTSVVGMVMPGTVSGVVSMTTEWGTTTSTIDFIVIPTPYPSMQQGDKLTGTGATGHSMFGSSVALSNDGNTVIVGGKNDNNQVGAAWIFTRNENAWTQQGNKLVGTDWLGQPNQGISVTLSADGNIAMVGGYHDDQWNGATWVYSRSEAVWTLLGSKMAATGHHLAGHSVSLSADGSRAIVGGYREGNPRDATVLSYSRSGTTWTKNIIGVTSDFDNWPAMGISVCLSKDGNTCIAGGYMDNDDSGAAWVFTRNENSWYLQGDKLVGNDASLPASQGMSVSLSADGNTAIVGGPDDNGSVGAAWIYTRSGTTWLQQGPKLVGTGAIGSSRQGMSVSLSADGNTAIVGGHTDNYGVGAAWVYTRSGTTWSQKGSKITGRNTSGVSYFGYSVSLSADGRTAAVGGPTDNSDAGAVWVFKEAVVGNPFKASVSIEADPAGAVSAGTPVTFTATPVNGGTPSYQWMKGKVAIPGETGPTYTSASLADKDTITVVMTSSLNVTGNPATSNAIIVTFKTTAIGEIGIGSLPESQKFEVYPVPSDGLLRVAINSPVSDTYSIQVYNSTGVKVYEKKEIRVNGLTETNIDLRQATQGLYYVVSRSSQKQIVRKILISR